MLSYFKEQKKKNILILLGHPDSTPTLSGEFAAIYEASAKQAGHEVRRINLGDMHFDPILHKGYKEIQTLEPDLKSFQESLKWCDHFTVIYPNWWCTMPALLKGLFDRAWLPGTCFSFYKTGMKGHFHMWRRLQVGKTARVVVVSGTHPLLIWLLFGDYTNEIGKAILWFSGFKVRFSRLGPSETAPEWKKDEWRQRLARLARSGE